MQRREGKPASGNFEFTPNEMLFNQLAHDRFLALLNALNTSILHVTLTTNLYGEFLFITLRHAARIELERSLTFYGLGFHDQRERWITDTWAWYDAHAQPDKSNPPVAKADVLRTIDERKREVEASARHTTQSNRARFFEMLADLTDEDGALAEMEDLEALGYDFDAEDDELR
jgi:hypothetical protein